MKKVFLTNILIALLATTCVFSCKEDDDNTPANGNTEPDKDKAKGKIIGEILDGESSMKNAEVYLFPAIAQLTYSDGYYIFENLPEGFYFMQVSKKGYQTRCKSTRIVNEKSETLRFLMQEKEKGTLEIMPQYLDFGGLQTINKRQFSMYRGNKDVVNWHIDKGDCAWIKSIEPSNGVLKKDSTNQIPIVITIDRNKLSPVDNENQVLIQISSDNGGEELLVTAFKDGYDYENDIVTDATLLDFGMNKDKLNFKVECKKDQSTNAQWLVETKCDWITISPTSFNNQKDAIKPINITIDRTKLNDTINEDFIYLTLNNTVKSALTITVRAEKKIVLTPQQAILTGDTASKCPNKTVGLSAQAQGATSYRWYKNGTIISGERSNIYTVTTKGIYNYSASGVNENGEGMRSEAKAVTISDCPNPPARAYITGEDKNTCPNTTVTLTASTSGYLSEGAATSYRWYKDGVFLIDADNTLIVVESGTYSVEGVNISGVGARSTGKRITINSCIPDNPTVVSAVMSEKGIKLSWDRVPLATGYKIQICNNSAMTGCDRVISPDINEYNPSYDIDGSTLFCGMNYFKVIATNSIGESSGKSTSLNRAISITAPSLTCDFSGYMSWTYSRIKGTSTTISYGIYRKIGDSSTWIMIEEKITNTGYIPSYEPEFGEDVYYKIRAYIETECGEFENYSGSERAW